MKDQKKRNLYLGLGISLVLILVIVGAYFALKNTQFSIYNVGSAGECTSETNCNFKLYCQTTFEPTWDGTGVGCGVAADFVGWSASTPIADVEAKMLPLRAKYNEFLSSNNIIPGQSTCHIDITASKGDSLYSQAPYTDSEYGGMHTNLPGHLVATNSGLLVNPGTTGYYPTNNPFYYYEDYKCVLDTPFPSSNGLNGVSIYRWISVKATLDPYVPPCTGCACTNSCGCTKDSDCKSTEYCSSGQCLIIPKPVPNIIPYIAGGLLLVLGGGGFGLYKLSKKRKR
jgi:hypothetical protein